MDTLDTTADIDILDSITATLKDFLLKVSNKGFAVLGGFVKLCFDLSITNRVKVTERKVLHLLFNGCDTKSVSNRSVNLHSLKGDITALLLAHTLDSTHIMETVSKFDDNNADVITHSDEHFSQVLCLLLFPVTVFDFCKFCETVNKQGNICTELS